jgi:glutamyl/glutaminyl-tRNA synthetase
MENSRKYRGRLAPSPTGLLHLGHARTFWIAFERAREHGGKLVLRNEDLDIQRCRREFVEAMFEDLRWLGIYWDEGPNCDGPFAPYSQSQRRAYYLDAWNKLRDGGFIYPCTCSRKEVAQAASAPNDLDDEPVYPGTCRPNGHIATAASLALSDPERREGESNGAIERGRSCAETQANASSALVLSPAGVNWRFRVPDDEEICITDLHLGPQRFTAGRDFGDFLVWRRDDVPAYQLAVVVDDATMQITEVVRGADLLKSTARQILLYRALGLTPPKFYHCDLVRDENGVRLAKRHDSLSIRKLRELGWKPEQVREANWSSGSV